VLQHQVLLSLAAALSLQTQLKLQRSIMQLEQLLTLAQTSHRNTREQQRQVPFRSFPRHEPVRYRENNQTVKMKKRTQ
jgi:hypothetical protein